MYIRSESKCTNCSEGDIEDEKHFVVYCPLYENIRVTFFDKVIDLCPNFRYMDTSSKFVWLFTKAELQRGPIRHNGATKKLQLKHKNSLFTLQTFHYNYY
jgi:hypothetical protein